MRHFILDVVSKRMIARDALTCSICGRFSPASSQPSPSSWFVLPLVPAQSLTQQVLYKLFKQSRATQRLSSFGAITSTCSDEQCTSCTQDAGKRPNLRRLLSNTRSQGSGGCTSSSVSEQPTMAMYQLQDKLMGVALRISLYPVTLIVVNTIVTSGYSEGAGCGFS